jgi:hypothetical protein
MSYFDLLFTLSAFITLAIAVLLRRRSVIAVAACSFAVTNAVAFFGLISAEAVWNRMPAYSWRFQSQLLDGAIRGLGAFLFHFPSIQGRIVLGVALVSIVFAVLKLVLKQQPSSHTTSRQFTIEMALVGIYFCAVIAWFVQAIVSVYSNRQGWTTGSNHNRASRGLHETTFAAADLHP